MKGKIIVEMRDVVNAIKVYGEEEENRIAILHNGVVSLISFLAKINDVPKSVVISAILHDLYEKED